MKFWLTVFFAWANRRRCQVFGHMESVQSRPRFAWFSTSIMLTITENRIVCERCGTVIRPWAINIDQPHDPEPGTALLPGPSDFWLP